MSDFLTSAARAGFGLGPLIAVPAYLLLERALSAPWGSVSLTQADPYRATRAVVHGGRPPWRVRVAALGSVVLASFVVPWTMVLILGGRMVWDASQECLGDGRVGALWMGFAIPFIALSVLHLGAAIALLERSTGRRVAVRTIADWTSGFAVLLFFFLLTWSALAPSDARSGEAWNLAVSTLLPLIVLVHAILMRQAALEVAASLTRTA